MPHIPECSRRSRWIDYSYCVRSSARDFDARQAAHQVERFRHIAYAICEIMAVGAMFASCSIMFAVVRVRTKEIATLRAIGFGGGAVVTSVLAESLALSVTGAAV